MKRLKIPQTQNRAKYFEKFFDFDLIISKSNSPKPGQVQLLKRRPDVFSDLELFLRFSACPTKKDKRKIRQRQFRSF